MTKTHGATQLTTRRQIDQRARNCRRRADGYRSGAHHGVVQLAHRQGPHQQIHILRSHRLAAGRHIGHWRRNKGNLGCVLTLGGIFKLVDQAHAQCTVSTDGFEHGQGFGVAVDVVLQLCTGVANIPRIDKNRRDPGVDHRHVQGAHSRHFKIVHQVAGREHRTACTLFIRCRVEKLQLHFGCRKSHAIQFEVTGFLHGTVCDRYMGNDGLADIGLPDTHHRRAVLRDTAGIHQTAADRERAHGRRQVAAVAAPVYKRLVDRDLTEQIVDVVIGVQAFAQDHGFAGAGRRRPHAVDLFFVGVGAADYP